ncbi:hypothetical protein GCM10028818_55320 [Spirosoma horti]
MNLINAKPLAGNYFRSVGQKAILPQRANVSIPAGLDWVIKQRLTSVIAYTLIDTRYSAFEVEDLCRLDKLLTPRSQLDIHNVVLYGYELSTLLSFLMEQEKQYHIWSVGLVPDWALRTMQADLRGLLPKIRCICRQVDLYADRPVYQR